MKTFTRQQELLAPNVVVEIRVEMVVHKLKHILDVKSRLVHVAHSNIQPALTSQPYFASHKGEKIFHPKIEPILRK